MDNDISPCYIRLLGGLEITRNGKLLHDPHRRGMKSYAVLSYLLLRHGQSVPSDKLARVSGIGSEGANVPGALKVLIYRIRKRLADGSREAPSCIHATMAGYAWNMSCGIRVDLFEAEALCEKVLNATELSSLSAFEIANLADLCGRELLPEMYDDEWADTARRRFYNLHASAMDHALGLMWEAGDIKQVIRTCHQGLANAPKSALLWRHMRRAMKAVTRQHKAGIDASG